MGQVSIERSPEDALSNLRTTRTCQAQQVFLSDNLPYVDMSGIIGAQRGTSRLDLGKIYILTWQLRAGT
jgi:hypothetical protein